MSASGVPRLLSLKFKGPAGVLEGILRCPCTDPQGAALLCHPHPLHGGTMHSPVIFRAARAFHRRGYATLRFNFRGVGLSTGSFDSGEGEKDDVRAALDVLCEKVSGRLVTLVGYSFGSWVGFSAAGKDPRISRLVGIGVPLRLNAFDFLRETDRPVLFIQGSEDTFGSVEEVRNQVTNLGPRAKLVVIEGADHLFRGELDKLEGNLYQELAPRSPER